MDDARRLRDRADSRAAALTRDPRGSLRGAPVLLARTKVHASYPATAAVYYACETQGILGAEAEGGPGVLSTNGDTVYAFNLGSGVPPQGTPVVLTFVGNRWVFRHDG